MPMIIRIFLSRRIAFIFVWIGYLLFGISCQAQPSGESELVAVVLTPAVSEPSKTLAPTPTIEVVTTRKQETPRATQTPTVTSTVAQTSSQLETPTITATATAKIVQVTPDSTAPTCSVPAPQKEAEVTFSFSPAFCIVWVDKFDNEIGYLVSLDYSHSGERFVYEIFGADAVQIFVPEADAPRLNESREQCLNRQEFTVFVTAILPDGEWQIDGFAMTTHCNVGLPTATSPPP